MASLSVISTINFKTITFPFQGNDIHVTNIMILFQQNNSQWTSGHELFASKWKIRKHFSISDSREIYNKKIRLIDTLRQFGPLSDLKIAVVVPNGWRTIRRNYFGSLNEKHFLCKFWNFFFFSSKLSTFPAFELQGAENHHLTIISSRILYLVTKDCEHWLRMKPGKRSTYK